MSEQNQLAISPVAAGLTGAAIGGVGNYFLGVGAKPAKGYGSTKELLTLEKDKFEALAKAVEEKGDDAAKAEFKKLADGRVTVSEAGDALVREQANTRHNLASTVQSAGINVDVATEKAELDKTQAALKKFAEDAGLNKTEADSLGDMKTKAKAEVNTKTTAALAEGEDKWSDARKAIEKQIKDETDATKKAKLEKQRNALVKKEVREALAKDESTAYGKFRKKATEIIADKKAAYREAADNNAAASKKYTDAIISKVGENDKYKAATAKADGSPIERLKHAIGKLSEKADDLRKAKADELVGDNGALKDLDTSKFGKFLKKSKMWPTIIAAGVLGAAGVALAYIVGPKNPTPKDVA